MEASELFRGRLFDHLQLVVRDLAASRRFYDTLLQSLGIPVSGEGSESFWANELVVYHPGYFAAFVRDPDGNNVEIVHHGPAARSSTAVRITF